MNNFELPDNNFHKKVKKLITEIEYEINFCCQHIKDINNSVDKIKDRYDLIIKKLDDNK